MQPTENRPYTARKETNKVLGRRRLISRQGTLLSLAYYGDNRFPHPQVPDKSLYYARLNKGSRNNNLIYYLNSVLKPCEPDPHQNKATHP